MWRSCDIMLVNEVGIARNDRTYYYIMHVIISIIIQYIELFKYKNKIKKPTTRRQQVSLSELKSQNTQHYNR